MWLLTHGFLHLRCTNCAHEILDHPGLSSRAPPGAPVQIFDPFELT